MIVLIVIDKNRKIIGVYNENWIKDKAGILLGEYIFMLDKACLFAKSRTYYAEVLELEEQWHILIKEGVDVVMCFQTSNRHELNAVLSIVKARKFESKEKSKVKNKNHASAIPKAAALSNIRKSVVDDDYDYEVLEDYYDLDDEPKEKDNFQYLESEAVPEKKGSIIVGIPNGAKRVINDSKPFVSVGLNNEVRGFSERYKHKFYLDANHYVTFGSKKGDIHPHTWEISIEIKNKKKDKVTRFSELESAINSILKPYQLGCLNEIQPFDKINPVTENLGQFFKEQISDKIRADGWEILELEISESANRSFIL